MPNLKSLLAIPGENKRLEKKRLEQLEKDEAMSQLIKDEADIDLSWEPSPEAKEATNEMTGPADRRIKQKAADPIGPRHYEVQRAKYPLETFVLKLVELFSLTIGTHLEEICSSIEKAVVAEQRGDKQGAKEHQEQARGCVWKLTQYRSLKGQAHYMEEETVREKFEQGQRRILQKQTDNFILRLILAYSHGSIWRLQ